MVEAVAKRRSGATTRAVKNRTKSAAKAKAADKPKPKKPRKSLDDKQSPLDGMEDMYDYPKPALDAALAVKKANLAKAKAGEKVTATMNALMAIMIEHDLLEVPYEVNGNRRYFYRDEEVKVKDRKKSFAQLEAEKTNKELLDAE